MEIKRAGEKVVVLGAGGHASSCMSVLLELGVEIVAFTSNIESQKKHHGIRVIAESEAIVLLQDQTEISAFIAIGDNSVRAEIANRLIEKSINLISIVSPSSHVDENVQIEPGVVVMPGSLVRSNSYISQGTIINSGAVVDHDCFVGEYSHIAPNATLTGSVRVGDRCLIGAGSVVLPKVKICDEAIVGAGSVVVRNLDENAKFAGVPAKKLGD